MTTRGKELNQLYSPQLVATSSSGERQNLISSIMHFILKMSNVNQKCLQRNKYGWLINRKRKKFLETTPEEAQT